MILITAAEYLVKLVFLPLRAAWLVAAGAVFAAVGISLAVLTCVLPNRWTRWVQVVMGMTVLLRCIGEDVLETAVIRSVICLNSLDPDNSRLFLIVGKVKGKCQSLEETKEDLESEIDRMKRDSTTSSPLLVKRRLDLSVLGIQLVGSRRRYEYGTKTVAKLRRISIDEASESVSST